jgi:hypothetical protein
MTVLAAAAVAAAPAAAQNGGRSGEISVKGGLSFANVSNQGLLPGQLNGRNGFAVGLAATSGGLLGFGLEGLRV